MNVIDKLVQKINKNEVENKVETLVLNFSFFFFKKKECFIDPPSHISRRANLISI